MSLRECDAVVGDALLRSDPMKVTAHQNAVLVPQTVAQDHDLRWGAYTGDGVLIEEAAYKRGPGRNLVGHSEKITFAKEALLHLPGRHIYGGAIHRHYGHHLLSVLPRYWWLKINPLFCPRIAIHTFDVTVREWLQMDFVKATIGSLGLCESDFIAIDKETFCEELVVPEASFTELSCASVEFSQLVEQIGKKHWSQTKRDEPVFLSKASLNAGVSKIVNEDDFVNRLAREGVRVVEPHLLSLEEQIKLVSEHSIIGGMLGSALHTVLFAECGKTIVALSPNDQVPSNFLLIDGLKFNSCRYFCPEDNMTNLGPTGFFQVTWRMQKPVILAEEFLRRLETANSGRFDREVWAFRG